MSEFGDTVNIEVTVMLPWANKKIPPFHYAISRQVAREALIPLPREIEFDPYQRYKAEEQSKRRRAFIDVVARQIAGALLSACESQDTDHGYEKGRLPYE